MSSKEIDALEAIAIEAQAGRSGIQQLVEAFLDTVVIVPSGGDMSADATAFQPVLVSIDAAPHIAVFGTPEDLQAIEHIAKHAVTMRGGDLIDRIRPGVGIAVSIRETGFNLAPDLVDAIRASRGSKHND